jgi:hypothetical protein
METQVTAITTILTGYITDLVTGIIAVGGGALLVYGVLKALRLVRKATSAGGA